jgi:Rrf2 family protein
MLTTTSQHALRALVLLARAGAARSTLGRDLAREGDIPANYLAKILLALQRAGVVKATRGSGGGYRLAAGADEITLIRVVEALEGQAARPQCLLGHDLPCSDERDCSAHGAWREVRTHYVEFLERTTLAQIAGGTSDGPAAIPPEQARREAP